MKTMAAETWALVWEQKSGFTALKPTIYKFKITLADIERNHYDTLNLTLALHPSETLERMMVRVLAFCMNAQEGLSFTKGLCAVEEPDIWAHTLEGQIALWIDVGEPAFDRIKKATRISQTVKIYGFNLKSTSWWTQGRTKFDKLNLSVVQFQWESIKTLTALVKRTMDLSITLTENIAYIAAENGECEVSWVSLQTADKTAGYYG